MTDIVDRLHKGNVPGNWINPEQSLLNEAAAEIERMTDDVDGMIKNAIIYRRQIRELTAEREALLIALIDIAEYWNGSANDRAVTDALWHIGEVSADAIARARREKA